MSSIQFNKLITPNISLISLESNALTEPGEKTTNLKGEAVRNSSFQEVNKKKEIIQKGKLNHKEEGNLFTSSFFKNLPTLQEINQKEIKKEEAVNQKDEVNCLSNQPKVSDDKEWRAISSINVPKINEPKNKPDKTIPKRRHKKVQQSQSIPYSLIYQTVANLAHLEVKDAGACHRVNFKSPSFSVPLGKNTENSEPNLLYPGVNSESRLPSSFSIPYGKKPGNSEPNSQYPRANLVPWLPSSFSAPRVAEPKNSQPNLPNPPPKAVGYKVTIMPVDYPKTLLTVNQGEEIRDQLTCKLDQLEVYDGFYPQFTGYGFKSGACILSCDSQASKDWLVSCVEDLYINSADVKLKVGSLQDIYQNVRVGIFFPGSKIPDDLLIRRLILQNPEVTDIKKWTLIGGKKDGKGFFGVLRIPTTSFEYLERRNLLMSYGMSKVKLRYLEKKGGTYSNKKSGWFKEGSNTVKGSGISGTAESYRTYTVTQSCNESSGTEDFRIMSESTNDNAWELDNYGGPSSVKSTRGAVWESGNYGGPNCSRPERGGGWKSNNYGGTDSHRPERAAAMESDNSDGPDCSRPEIDAVMELGNYGGPDCSRPERGSAWKSDNYGRLGHSRPERGGAWKSNNYGAPDRSRPERDGAIESDNYGGPDYSRHGRGTAWGPNNYGGPASIGSERGAAWKSNNYSGPASIRSERGAAWKSDNYSGPAGTLSKTADTWMSGDYNGPASIRPEREPALKSGNYGGPAGMLSGTSDAWESKSRGGPAACSRSEKEAAMKSGNYGGSDSTGPKAWDSASHDKPVMTRPERPSGWVLSECDRPTRKRLKRSGGWESTSEDGPARHRNEGGSGWEQDDHNRPSRKIPERRGVWKLNDQWRPAMARNDSDRMGGLESEDLNRPCWTRPEICWQESTCLDGPAWTKRERVSGWGSGVDSRTAMASSETIGRELGDQGIPAKTITERVDGWKSNDINRPGGTKPETSGQELAHKEGAAEAAWTRPDRPFGWDFNNTIRTAVTRPETSASGWGSALHNGPAWTRLERPSRWESGVSLKTAAPRSETSEWKFDNHGMSAKARRAGGQESPSDFNRPGRTRPEISGWESSHQDGPAWTRRERMGGCESKTYR